MCVCVCVCVCRALLNYLRLRCALQQVTAMRATRSLHAAVQYETEETTLAFHNTFLTQEASSQVEILESQPYRNFI